MAAVRQRNGGPENPTCLGLLYGLQSNSAGQTVRTATGHSVQSGSPSIDTSPRAYSCVFQELEPSAGALSDCRKHLCRHVPPRGSAWSIWAPGKAPKKFRVAQKGASGRNFGLRYIGRLPTRRMAADQFSRQIVVRIAKALSLDSRILLLDEPTSALAPDEVDALFDVFCAALTRRGIGSST